MTVSGSTYKNTYTLDGSTTVFPFTFKILQDSDMLVTLYNTTTSSGTTVSSSSYTVTGAGLDTGTRTVTYAGAASYGSTYRLILQPNLGYTQPTDYISGDDFDGDTHETSLDRLAIQIRQLKELTDRTLKFDSAQTNDIELPSGTAGYLYTDGSSYSVGTPSTTELGYNGSIQHGADASKSATPSIGDLYFATDTGRFYKCESSNIWSYNGVFYNLTVDSDLTVPGATSLASLALTDELTSDSNITTSGSVNIGGNLSIGGSPLMGSIKDDDTMADDSATALCTQQSIKAYVDNTVVYITGFGTWTSRNNNTVYLAATDLFVCATGSGTPSVQIVGYTDSSNPPTTVRDKYYSTDAAGVNGGVSFPVKSGDYWKVTGATTVSELSIS